MLNRMRAVTFATLMLATASPAITIDTAVAQAQSSTKIASTVLATVNGQRLTQGMVNRYIEFGEFLAGYKFSQADKSWFTILKVKHFRKNTNKEMQGYKEIEKILTQIRQLRNPIKIAQVREKVMAGIHLDLFAKNQVNKPSIMTIVYKYSPVFYTNPKYKIVITKRTLDSLHASTNFVAKVTGKPLDAPNYKRSTQIFEQTDFKTHSPEQMRNLATAESRWVGLREALPKASPQQRREIINYIKRLMQQRGNSLGNIARSLESKVPKFVSTDKIGQEYRKGRRDFRVRNQIDRMNGGYNRLWDGMFGR